MVDKIKEIRIELSNVCNLSDKHDKCPANKAETKRHLNIKYVILFLEQFNTLNEGFNGTIGFHQYNEPLIDPRLYYIVLETKRLFKDATILIWTNKTILTKELREDFSKFNVEFIESDYSNNPNLDNRLNIYKTTDRIKKGFCLAPYYQLILNHKGHIALCCYDWMGQIIFGDIRDATLFDILNSDFMKAAYNNLSNGKYFSFCNNCYINYETL
jgi:hypothetical protein